MLEKVVQKRFFNIMNNLDYISKYQNGFMPGRSTQETIFEILKDLCEAMNSKLITGLLFLDVKKAFDSLDHNILLTKLQALGVSGKMIQWFSSYLDRMQQVRHNGQLSDEENFKCGIPQGSCLGPTLFIFYINAVFASTINETINVMMFADDCLLYKSGNSSDIVLNSLQQGLDSYTEWGRLNNMHLNAKKTKAMLIFPSIQYNLHRPLITDGGEIQYVHTFNYLGTVIDDQLRFTSHYILVKRKIENKIFVLSKLRTYVDNKSGL